MRAADASTSTERIRTTGFFRLKRSSVNPPLFGGYEPNVAITEEPAMDPDLRRRLAADREVAPEGAERALALPDGLVGPGNGLNQETPVGEAHPFWSERAQAERELQLMRPPHLDEAAGNANITSTASSSTELRPSSTGVDSRATGFGQQETVVPSPADAATPEVRESDRADQGIPSGRGVSSNQESEAATGLGTAPSPELASVPNLVAGSANSFPTSSVGDGGVAHGHLGSNERLGMRPGERLVVEEMKNLLVGLYEQNQILVESQRALQRRVEQMENDAMHSASSGGDGDKAQTDQELGWVPENVPYLGRFIPPEEKTALDYKAGIEEGLRRAAEAAQSQTSRPSRPNLEAPRPVAVAVPEVPLAPPRRSPSPHTPNGTRAPSGTPPRTPTPVFGSPAINPPAPAEDFKGFRGREPSVESRRGHPLAQSAEWSAAVTQETGARDFWGSVGIGIPGASGVGFGSTGISGSVGSSGLGLGPLGFANQGPSGFANQGMANTGMVAGSLAGMFAGSGGGNSGNGGGNSGFGVGNSGTSSSPIPPVGEGRNAFAPGDRTWWKLPPLPDAGTEDACVAVSDWLTQIQPIMSDLSDSSWVWWQRVMEIAQKAYLRWQQAGPLEKSLVVCEAPTDLLDPRLSRLEARALGMILESLPVRIKDELVVTKALTTTNAIYRILLAFQPGGLAERQKLISNLQEPGVASTARYCSDQLRRWHRWLSRALDLGVNPPDPAILLAGLDRLCSVVIGAHAQLSFRCNISRTQHQLDFCPTVTSVTAYARLLQAEMETLALSGSDPELEDAPKLTKKQRAAALRKEQEAKGGGKTWMHLWELVKQTLSSSSSSNSPRKAIRVLARVTTLRQEMVVEKADASFTAPREDAKWDVLAGPTTTLARPPRKEDALTVGLPNIAQRAATVRVATRVERPRIRLLGGSQGLHLQTWEQVPIRELKEVKVPEKGKENHHNRNLSRSKFGKLQLNRRRVMPKVRVREQTPK